MASGVSTGKISRRNSSRTCLRSSSVSSAARRMTMPVAAAAPAAPPRSGSGTARRPVRGRLADLLELLARRHAVGPGADRDAGLHLLLQPPTRTMKNSSRFELKMARNLSRSSSGTVGSCASSSTRRLNSSQLSSRLMYRDGSSRLVGAADCIESSPNDGNPTSISPTGGKSVFHHSPESGIFRRCMDAPEPPASPNSPRSRRISRRMLFRLAGTGVAGRLSIEAAPRLCWRQRAHRHSRQGLPLGAALASSFNERSPTRRSAPS